METIDIFDDISAIIHTIERLPFLVVIGGYLLISLILRDL